MRALFLIACLTLAACADMPQNGASPAAGQAPQGAQQAYFESYPSQLFEAAAMACNRPGQTVVQPSANEVRCESLPDPQSAAAIILQFNGTVEDLPKLIISFSGVQTPQGYLVTADAYLRVPTKTGEVQQIRIPDARNEAGFAELLRSAGGRPL